VYLRLLIRRATPCTWPSLDDLGRRIGVRRAVELRSSSRGDSPFTAGWRRPVIVMPLATIAGLPADQLEAILLHELAHIRRFDYVAEWGLQAMETLFFYHPAVWWMTAMVRRERERSCDDMAIAAGADRACYARALMGLEEMRVPVLANGGAGADLQGRVTRILGERPRPAAWPVLVLLALTVVAQQAATPYQKWMNEDVLYLIHPYERVVFESLRTDDARMRYIEQFWERRDPTPGTAANEMKEEHYRRIAYSNERFWEKDKPGWQTERGRAYILFGPPDEIEAHPNEKYEKWLYKGISGVGARVIFEFVNGVRK
jgi:GWxTD domain-containing protein